MNPSATTRRRFLFGSGVSALTFGTTLGRTFAQGAACSPLVGTSLGKLRGECFDGGRVFRGVPFAQPPIAGLRFRPSAPARPWTAERDATRFGAAPLQPGDPRLTQSEDCLYLNVWAPAGRGPFPVFVWIHGGGFTGGHASEPIYDGSRFAREGVVCVTVGYRLGVFGFLDLEPLLGASYAGTANNALGDLLQALAWVRAHIADFGGDPQRVTVGGESAGAKLTDILMGVPAAKPLFQSMVSESGGAERVWPRATAQGIGQGFGATWTKRSGQPAASILNAAGTDLIAAQQDFMKDWPQHFPLRPEIDDYLLRELPIANIRKGSSAGKRLLIGTNRDESALFVGPRPAHDASAADLGNMTVAEFRKQYAAYAALYPDLTDEQRRIRALTAEEYLVPSIRVVDEHVKAGGSAWMYRLDFSEARGRLAGYAFHSLDVGLVWDKPHVDIGNDAEEAALAGQVHAAWVAFLQGRAPAAGGLPAWPAYTPGERSTMILAGGNRSQVEKQPEQAELLDWAGALG